MKRTIIFPFDDKATIYDKVSKIKELIGEHNVSEYDINMEVPTIEIRCYSWRKWREIKFICGLVKVYY